MDRNVTTLTAAAALLAAGLLSACSSPGDGNPDVEPQEELEVEPEKDTGEGMETGN
ncbi:hypothetical protein [Salibacterium aidingense]|uniref:hypothetical protein n=1 Tax=Salibacterium aidingense TaxID=384933 RepID=UPI00042416BF|nr:hypothetical protein [Salibacterium aidingense]